MKRVTLLNQIRDKKNPTKQQQQKKNNKKANKEINKQTTAQCRCYLSVEKALKNYFFRECSGFKHQWLQNQSIYYLSFKRYIDLLMKILKKYFKWCHFQTNSQ